MQKLEKQRLELEQQLAAEVRGKLETLQKLEKREREQRLELEQQLERQRETAQMEIHTERQLRLAAEQKLKEAIRKHQKTKNREVVLDEAIKVKTEKLEEEEQARECVQCLDQRACVAMVPCDHLCLCQSCADQTVKASSTNNCPLCRATVVGHRRIRGMV